MITVFPKNKMWGGNELNLWKHRVSLQVLVILWVTNQRREKASTYSTQIKERWGKRSKVNKYWINWWYKKSFVFYIHTKCVTHVLSKREEITDRISKALCKSFVKIKPFWNFFYSSIKKYYLLYTSRSKRLIWYLKFHFILNECFY